MNLGELVTAVANRCQMATTDPYYASIEDRINEALHAIEQANTAGWDWLREVIAFNTVANQQAYPFTTLDNNLTRAADGATIARILSVEVTIGNGYVPIERLNKTEARRVYLSSATSPTVERWDAKEQALHLFPTPSGVIACRATVVGTEPDLVDASDTPVLPAIYHRTLVAAAAGLVLRSTQRVTDAQVEEAAAERGIARMFTYANPAGGPGQVRRRQRW